MIRIVKCVKNNNKLDWFEKGSKYILDNGIIKDEEGAIWGDHKLKDIYELNDLFCDKGYKFKYIDNSDISDGSHTFEELYYHRMVLFSMICNLHKDKAWKSKLHDDGTMYDDYFIVGIITDEGDFTYHYHLDYWENFKVKELELAPKWDGHTSKDIVRLYSLLNNNNN